MSNKKPAFLFYPGDWLRDPGVRQLSPREKGVYIDLLIYLFDSGGYVSISEKNLMYALSFRVEEGEESKSVDDIFHGVIKKLLESEVIRRTEDGRLYNKRILRDLEEKDEISQKRSEAGKLGAQKKWQADGKCYGKPMANAMANGWQTDGKPPEGCHDEKMAKDSYSISSSISSSDINSPPSARAREEEPILPKNMPATAQQAVEMCIGLGVPEEFIIQAWHEKYAVGFLDKGNPIMNWPAYINAYWMRHMNVEQRRKQNNKPKETKNPQYDEHIETVSL